MLVHADGASQETSSGPIAAPPEDFGEGAVAVVKLPAESPVGGVVAVVVGFVAGSFSGSGVVFEQPIIAKPIAAANIHNRVIPPPYR